jgi:hypothetical protein
VCVCVVSRAPNPALYTAVYFSSEVRLQGLGADDMDIGASNSFVHVTADAMQGGVSTSDIDVTAIKNAAESTSSLAAVLGPGAMEVADKAVDISFTTRLNLESSGYLDPQLLVAARQDELTAAFADPNTATVFVMRSVEYGSATVTAATEVVFGTPVYSPDIVVSYTTTAPTLSPGGNKKSGGGGGGRAGENNVIVYVVVIIGAVILSGVAGYVLSTRGSKKKELVDGSSAGGQTNKDYYKSVGSRSELDDVAEGGGSGDLELVVIDDYYKEEEAF